MKNYDSKGRYDRQLPILHDSGQQALDESKIIIVGLGGLGSPVATYLTAAGVGELVLVDNDSVTRNNLNRQFLHWEENISQSKTSSFREKLTKFNSEIEIHTLDLELNPDTVTRLPKADLIVGALDNFRTRYLVNKFAVNQRVPYIHGAIENFQGQLTTIIPGKTPCIGCIFPDKPPEREEIPVIGCTAGTIGSLMASESIKYITGKGELMTNRLLLMDLKQNQFETLELSRDPNCPTCGNAH